jgi:heme-degrading monooxygenase HmoA
MIATVSEVWPNTGRRDEYFALSLRLRPALEAIDGFISAQRFESETVPGKYLSFSVWRDQVALAKRRNPEEQRLIMAKGRNGVLRDYRIKVTQVLHEYGMTNRSNALLGEAPTVASDSLSVSPT